MDNTTTRIEMEELLRGLGIGAGTRLVVHSAFHSVGYFDGGPENFCRMLCDLVSSEGLVMMPGLVRYPADGQEFTYNPLTTPTNTGILPESFRKMPGVLRSLDPTHSFCAWGKNACCLDASPAPRLCMSSKPRAGHPAWAAEPKVTLPCCQTVAASLCAPGDGGTASAVPSATRKSSAICVKSTPCRNGSYPKGHCSIFVWPITVRRIHGCCLRRRMVARAALSAPVRSPRRFPRTGIPRVIACCPPKPSRSDVNSSMRTERWFLAI